MPSHTRIIQHPFASLIQGGRLDSYAEEKDRIFLKVQGFQPLSSELFERDGKIYEQVRAKHIPLSLTFTDISKLKRNIFFTQLDSSQMDDPSRVIAYMLSWKQPKQRDIFYLFGLRLPIGADMEFFARKLEWEQTDFPGTPLIMERDWSPAPPMPQQLVPQPKELYKEFGGDPISIRLDDASVRRAKSNKTSQQGSFVPLTGFSHPPGATHSKRNFHRRLFIGGVDIQPKLRPQVDAVLNLGENPSRWVRKGTPLDSRDRAIGHGEGSEGMNLATIRKEAEWVIERLRRNQRVLVHCTAGLNRSVTVCCAVLILLEDLSAEDALARVREHHPWARPDSHHWLMLKWLAKNTGKVQT